MTYNGFDRRSCLRVYLKSDTVAAFLRNSKSSAYILSSVLDVSEGGFGLGFQKDDSSYGIFVGDILEIEHIIGREELVNDSKIILSVKWVLGHEGMNAIGAGCEFIHLDPEYKEKISRFINRNNLINS